MLSLIAKDFKLMFANKSGLKTKILSWIFSVVVGLLFIAIETFVFVTILNKIKIYENAAVPFFSIFLFIISMMLIVFAVYNTKKLFFDEEDVKYLASFPISNSKKVLSKLIFLLLIQYAANLIFTTPLFIAYGIIFEKLMFFFYSVVFYPLLTFIFEAGVALIIVYPYKLISDFMKKHVLVQFIVTLVIAFALTYVYGQVLNLFITLVSSNQLDSLFNADVVEDITNISKYLVPVNFLVEIFINKSMKYFLSYFSVAAGAFLLGLTLLVYFYHNFTNMIVNEKKKDSTREMKILPVKKALIRKEFIILFKDSNYLFSFTGLLAVQPFLSVLIIKSINTVFASGSIAYYISLLKNFLPLMDILIMMLITLIISQGANQYITMEDKNIRLIKMMPVKIKTQLSVKVLIPFTLSASFCFISYLALLVTGTISWTTFVFGVILTILLLCVVDLVSLFEELKIKRNKPRSYFLSNTYSYVLPILYFIVSLVGSYFDISIYIAYGLGIIIFILLSLPFVINIKSKVKNLFDELEVSN